MATFKAGSVIENVFTTATAAGTTTLTLASQTYQQFTGTLSQTITLPNATTLPNAKRFYIANRSTQTITVNFFGGSLAATVTANFQKEFVLVDNSSSAGVWDISTGSSGGAGAYTQFTLANNQSSPASVTGFLLDSSMTTGFSSDYSILRYHTNSNGSENTAFYTNLGTGFGNVVFRVIEQLTDQKILAGGSFATFNGNTRNCLVRVDSTGTEDTAFYTNLGTGFNAAVQDIQVQTDDAIVAGGAFTSFNGNTRNHMVRLNNDGTEDTTFYTNLGTGFNNNVLQVVLQTNGKILAGGTFTDLNGSTLNRLARLNTDGTEDTGFSTNIGSGFSSGTVNSIALQSDGKILVGGSFTSFNGNTRNRLIRLNTDGTEDTGFYTALGTGFDGPVQMVSVRQSDDTILVGGNFTQLNSIGRVRFVKLDSAGAVDTAFYTNLGTSFNQTVYQAKYLSNGKIVIGGQYTSFNGNTRNRLVRLNFDGTEDTAFYTALGAGFAAGTVTVVWSIVPTTSNLMLIGGDYTLFNSNTRNRLVALNDGTTELVEEGTLRGLYRLLSGAWDLVAPVSGGDNAGITFSITSVGQLQYTSTNITTTLISSYIRWINILL